LILHTADIIVMHKVENGHNDTILNKVSYHKRLFHCLIHLLPFAVIVEAIALL
jgi:hypothetical protein